MKVNAPLAFSGVVFLFLLLLAPVEAKAQSGEAFRQELAAQINTFRADERRTPVTLDPALDAIASQWAARLADAGEMEHRSRGNLSSLMTDHGWTAMNENLFMSSAPTAAPSEVLAAWKGSTGHRRNLLQANITRIGIGWATGPKGFFVVFNGAGG